MTSFFNDIEILESSKAKFNCYNRRSFPTYQQFLPFTELTVNLANDAIERDLGRIDMFGACDFILKRDLSPEAMLTALMYINRFKKRKENNTNKKLSSFTSADLFLISMMLASKYLFDDGTEDNVVNEEWAEDFGIENSEVNALEIDFLDAMDWRLHVESSEFIKLKQKICAYLAHETWNCHVINGSTYRELIIINNNNIEDITKTLNTFFELICKAILGCVIVYVGIIVGVHLMVIVVHARSTQSYYHWNHLVIEQDYSLNVTTTTIAGANPISDHMYIDDIINQSHKYHSTMSHSFIIRSKLLSTHMEQ